jgi:hypothetical protein
MCDYINIPNKPNMKELNQKLAIIQTKLKAKKSSYNSFGKYYFRKSEDILEAIKPFLMEQGVTVVINEEIISAQILSQFFNQQQLYQTARMLYTQPL